LNLPQPEVKPLLHEIASKSAMNPTKAMTGFTELVDDPTQLQKANVDAFFYNHTKRLGYKSYVKFYPEQKARTVTYLRSLVLQPD
jgi:hypothetical protein